MWQPVLTLLQKPCGQAAHAAGYVFDESLVARACGQAWCISLFCFLCVLASIRLWYFGPMAPGILDDQLAEPSMGGSWATVQSIAPQFFLMEGANRAAKGTKEATC